MQPKKTVNMGYNQIIGKVKFGEGCIINPTCSIICQGNGQIIFGDYNIIEEKAIIVNKHQGPQPKIMHIGSYNIFGIKSYVINSDIGDGNVLQPKAEIKDTKLGNSNLVGSQVKLSKKAINDHTRMFYPGKMKQVDIIDEEKHKQLIKGLHLNFASK